MPGNVQYRYLEVIDYTKPNSMGMVYKLLFDDLLCIPILYHEYLHYKGRKNEAEVWLKEHYFLRDRILANAPKEDEQLAVYLDEIIARFTEVKDELTLSMLKTDFTQTEQLSTLNQLIMKQYGPQMNRFVAQQYAERMINQNNMNININNMFLRWDPLKRFPLLGKEGAIEEGMLVKEILTNRKMQKNTLTVEEFQKVLSDVQLQRIGKEWMDLLKRAKGQSTAFDAISNLLQLSQGDIAGDELLVYKS